jgi:threonylcarbamoyladenosine tRNA methylthiotransferase MtaB
VARLPGVAEVITDKRELPDLLARAGMVDVPTGISTFAGHQRAYVKVQDGCMLRCSFCIIPHVRPHLASRPPEHIIAEVERLHANGYREFVLTGIHLGHYGVEWNRGRSKRDWTRLSHLLARLVRIDGDIRIRLSSIEATEVTRELVEVMAAYPQKICPHLHISLQSGSEAVLQRMRRRWGPRRFVDRCKLVQRALDQPAITSARRGTPAAEMPEQIAPDVKADRVRRLGELESELRDGYYASLLGRQLRVLVETPIESQPGYMVGTSCRYAPVVFRGDVSQRKQFVNVIAGPPDDGLIVAAGLVPDP